MPKLKQSIRLKFLFTFVLHGILFNFPNPVDYYSNRVRDLLLKLVTLSFGAAQQKRKGQPGGNTL